MKHAAYCGTREIYDDMEVSAKALIANSSVDKVHFVIEDAEFPRELPSIIECHDVSKQTYFKPGGANMSSQYTYMAMMRIALCHVLPDVDMVLSLDADTFPIENVDGIWDLPIEDCYFSAVPEWHRTSNGLVYCNFGVVYYNLEKLRDGKADECINVLNTTHFPWVEQCVGNYLCQGRIHEMPAEYNACWWTNKNAPGAKLIHYAGVSRDTWADNPLVNMYRSMPWEHVMELHNA